MTTAASPQNVTELFDPDDRYALTLKGYRAIGAEPPTTGHPVPVLLVAELRDAVDDLRAIAEGTA